MSNRILSPWNVASTLNLRSVRATLPIRECRPMVPHARLMALLILGLLALVPASASANPIAAGEGQSCTITAAGAALCWGSRSEGALGDGLTRPDSFDPVQVTGLTSGVSHIVSSQQGGGASTAVCAIVFGGAKCWGSNYAGKLGNGTRTARIRRERTLNDSGFAMVPPVCSLQRDASLHCRRQFTEHNHLTNF